MAQEVPSSHMFMSQKNCANLGSQRADPPKKKAHLLILHKEHDLAREEHME